MLFYCYLPSRLVADSQCACPTISAYNPVRCSVASTEGGGGKRERSTRSLILVVGPSSLMFTPYLRSFCHLSSSTFLLFLSLTANMWNRNNFSRATSLQFAYSFLSSGLDVNEHVIHFR